MFISLSTVDSIKYLLYTCINDRQLRGIKMIFEVAFLITAVVFTVVGLWMGIGIGASRTATITIDHLIENGYLRYKTDEDGEIHILPLKD